MVWRVDFWIQKLGGMLTSWYTSFTDKNVGSMAGVVSVQDGICSYDQMVWLAFESLVCIINLNSEDYCNNDI